MLFGRVIDGKEILKRLAVRTGRERFNLNITMKTV